MEELYETCRTACDLPSVEKDGAPLSYVDGHTVMTDLNNILIMDQ